MPAESSHARFRNSGVEDSADGVESTGAEIVTEAGVAEIDALAQQVRTARGKLPLQHDAALFEVLSESEVAQERELAEWIRGQRRKQRRMRVSEELAAERRDRKSAARIRRAEENDARWHRRALAARRRVSSEDARLAQLFRRAEWSSRALISVVVLGMIWAGVNVQRNLVPSGDMSDPLYWLSFGIEAMISIPIITIMVAATTAARWGRELARGKVIFFETALLGTTIALNTGPHLAAGEFGRAAEFAVAPVMVGVVIWLHAWVSARYALLIDGAPVLDRDFGPHRLPSERTDHAPTDTFTSADYRELIPNRVTDTQFDLARIPSEMTIRCSEAQPAAGRPSSPAHSGPTPTNGRTPVNEHGGTPDAFRGNGINGYRLDAPMVDRTATETNKRVTDADIPTNGNSSGADAAGFDTATTAELDATTTEPNEHTEERRHVAAGATRTAMRAPNEHALNDTVPPATESTAPATEPAAAESGPEQAPTRGDAENGAPTSAEEEAPRGAEPAGTTASSASGDSELSLGSRGRPHITGVTNTARSEQVPDRFASVPAIPEQLVFEDYREAPQPPRRHLTAAPTGTEPSGLAATATSNTETTGVSAAFMDEAPEGDGILEDDDLLLEEDNAVTALARQIANKRLSNLSLDQLEEILLLADESVPPPGIANELGVPRSAVVRALESALALRGTHEHFAVS